VDAQGNKVSNSQKMWDALRQVIPIPAQALTPKQQISQPSRLDEVLKGMGVQSTKRFTPAETLAYQRATQKGEGGEPLEGDKLEEAQTKFRLADAYRDAVMAKDQAAKQKAREDIDAARKSGTITLQDEERMMLAPYKYPSRLAATVARLPLEDALDVYHAVGLQEKRIIRAEIAQKVSSYYQSVATGKRSEKEYKALKPRIQQFFQDKP
jgi:hypothetical protein